MGIISKIVKFEIAKKAINMFRNREAVKREKSYDTSNRDFEKNK